MTPPKRIYLSFLEGECKLVPTMATDKMAVAGIAAHFADPSQINGVNYYRAMLAAAPDLSALPNVVIGEGEPFGWIVTSIAPEGKKPLSFFCWTKEDADYTHSMFRDSSLKLVYSAPAPQRLSDQEIINAFTRAGYWLGVDKEEIAKVVRACRDLLSTHDAAPVIDAREPVQAAQPDSQDAAQLYTCDGKGGEYERIGTAKGAGTMRGALTEDLEVYRDIKDGQLYYRSKSDFAARMLPLGAIAASQKGKA